jgi:prepilin-type N-terminal cleavage/methylation domain-containing protein
MRSRRSAAFTLVELLVVIAIIGILVALLLPAIQAAREAARRAQCKSQLRNLALAALNHHDVHKFFPTGGWGWEYVGDADRGFGEEQPGGWVYSILPYIEESNGHHLPSDGNPNGITQIQLRNAGQLIQQPITIINCPSRRAVVVYPNDKGARTPLNHVFPEFGGKLDYAANCGDQNLTACSTGPPRNLWTTAPYTEWRNWVGAGMFCATSRTGASQTGYGLPINGTGALRSPLTGRPELTGISFERSEVAIRHVTDGTSHTYLIGEKYLNPANYETGTDQADNETWCTGFNNDNFRSAFQVPLQDELGNRQFDRFGSAHASGFHMAYCDGSVDTITYDITERIHWAGGNRKDGEMTQQ